MIGIALMGAGRMARVHAKAIRAAGGTLVSAEIETFLGCVAAGTPPPINAIDGPRAVYLAEAAGASLRLGDAIELKTSCEVNWHDR